MAKREQLAVGSPIRVGLAGVGGWARLSEGQLGLCPDLRVVAVADVNRDVAEQAAARFGAKPFVDVRSMIVESPIDAVLMSLPHHEYPEYVRLVAQRGLHLLKEKPLARSFREAAEMTALFGPSQVFMIGTQRRFLPGFAALKANLSRVGRPILVRSHFLFNWGPEFGWRGEKSKAGFGAFGDAGYHCIDLLNWLIGPPLDVYAMQSGNGRDNPAHHYDTDDTGLCMLHYPGSLMGYIACSWVTTMLNAEMDVTVHGTAGTMVATADRFCHYDLSGGVLVHEQAPPGEALALAMRAKLAAFAAAIRSGGQNCPCSARENLLNMAVTEAAYLSGRTGQAQAPSRICDLHGCHLEDFLPASAARSGSADPA